VYAYVREPGWRMAEQTEVEWRPTCEQAGCIGIRLASARKCLAHASEEDTAAALKRVGETGAIDARGVPITRALLERILAAAPRGENEKPLIKGCRFDWATFTGDAEFGRTTFTNDARFDKATFTGDARFGRATFNADAEFSRATFTGIAWFDRATFTGIARFDRATFAGGSAVFDRATFNADARFGGATFKRRAGFDGATFNADARFGRATFNADAGFSRTTFNADAWFAGATFERRAWFGGVTFTNDAGFGGATFKRRAGFGGARFQQARQFGPVLAHRELVLDDVEFAQPVQIEVSSTGVCCRRALFAGGVQFRLRWACVVLDDTDLSAPSILAGIPRLSSEELARREQQVARDWQQELAGEISERPQLVSLRRTNVAGLGLSNVSAADCRFAGAHNLDKLRLESGISFATAPSPVSWGGRRWGGREVIAEERTWRADRSRRHWVAPGWPDWLDDQRPSVLPRGQIAGLYRALRKGREDVKNEPGAADFYYGEMEMRRHAATLHSVERALLTAFWMVSGYGLRATRALAALLVLLVLGTVGFATVGFAASNRIEYRPVGPSTAGQSAVYQQVTVPTARPGWTAAVDHSIDSTTALLRATEPRPLTAAGRAIEIALRLLGPLLLGLAVLAVRGRVKR
jgi:hypothetical protein